MISEDPFSQSYAKLLSGAYDVVDRLVLNAYFPVGQYGGGFRAWWRLLRGDDEALDNAHLMRMAGRFARRVRGWAEKNHVPVVNCVAGERKSEVATEYLPTDESFRGIFAILVGRAPAPVWDGNSSAQRCSCREETMNGNRPSHPPRQLKLTVTRNTIGPRLPKTTWCDTQALLAQLLVDVVREENPQRGGEYERQDP